MDGFAEEGNAQSLTNVKDTDQAYYSEKGSGTLPASYTQYGTTVPFPVRSACL